MANYNKFYLLLFLIFFVCGNTAFGQSIQELTALRGLLDQNNGITLPEEMSNGSQYNTKNEQDGIVYITAPKIKYQPKKGEWPSENKYLKWFNETDQDTSVMELYGFISDTSPEYFGYNIFTQRDSIAFWQHLPAPDNYILGAGDVVDISLWGETQLKDRYIIDRASNIYIDQVGLIGLRSKTVNEAKYLIENRFKQSFATLRGNTPSSFIDITIEAGKTINVHFVGEVNYPGIHMVHPFSSAITGLIQTGGIKTNGSLRNIKIKRNDEIIKIIDVYHYLLDGDLNNNIQLRENDVVIVPTRESTIEIDGSVVRNGYYEAIEGDNIKKMINYAGGIALKASGRVTLSRIIPIVNRANNMLPHEQHLISIDDLINITAVNGDIIYLHEIPPSFSEVSIVGQVKTPGTYKYTESMTLKDILELAGGIEDLEYLKTIHLDQIEIIRKNRSNIDNDIIKINLDEYLTNNKLDSLKLENFDLVVVHSNNNYLKSNNVTINGEIKVPGVYSLQNDNESLSSIIQRAGGFTDKAFPNGIIITRGEKNVIWDDLSQPLVAGDNIIVDEQPGVVEVKGYIYNPGLVRFSPGRSMKSYINASGGVTQLGNRNNIIVQYPNGNVKSKKFLFNPIVKEGCTIIVKPKMPKEPLNINEFLRDTASIIASLALIYTVTTN
jgi:protein involved in polysaccharide export with SLBB domain